MGTLQSITSPFPVTALTSSTAWLGWIWES